MNNLIAKNILENKASSALTSDKSLALVKPTYGFINTAEIVDQFASKGWNLSSASQATVRKIERQGYQKHLLRFRHESFKEIKGLSNDHYSIPELIAVNAHDGTSALNIYFGVFRIACMNGIIAGSTIASMRVIHSQNAIKKIHESIEELTDRIPLVAESVGKFSSRILTNDEKIEFARKAAEIRLKNTPHDVIDLNSVLRPKRMADTGSDLFSVFNVAQEKALRGGISYRTELKHFNGHDMRIWRNSRAVNSVSQSVKLNRELWDLAESFAS